MYRLQYMDTFALVPTELEDHLWGLHVDMLWSAALISIATSAEDLLSVHSRSTWKESDYLRLAGYDEPASTVNELLSLMSFPSDGYP